MDALRKISGAGGSSSSSANGSGYSGGGALSGASALFNPTKLLKKGWNGVTSPITAMKDTMMTASGTPRSAYSTSSSSSNSGGQGTSGGAMAAPVEYPSLFDVRDHAGGMSLGGGVPRNNSGGLDTGRSSRTNSRTASLSRDASGRTLRQTSAAALAAVDDVASLDEEERAYLEVCHHNLHSVLTNPKGGSWGGALLDVLYQNPLDAEIPMPTLSIPGLDLVSARDFDPYLKKYGKMTKQYEDNHALPISEQLSSSQVPSISVADEDVAKCLSVVPSLFFRPDFDLTDPALFEQVMSMKTSGGLQDELSGYLDRVEFTLLRQVSSRSDRFFEASTNQEVMTQSIRVACDQVATLRKTMDRLRNGLADKSLDIVSLHRRQKRIAELHEVVTMIEEVKNAESAVEALVQCEDYPSALDLIESSQTTLREHLKGIHGLSSLSDKLQGYRSLITAQISQRFISIVTSPEWMFQDDDAASSTSATSRKGSEEAESQTGELKRLTEVLFRLDALTDVVSKYRDQLTEEIKVVVKTVVTETIAMSGSSKSSGGDNAEGAAESKVSIQLRALTSDEFLKCVKMIFEHLLMVLERAVVVQKMLTKAMNKKVEEAEAEEAKMAEKQKQRKASQTAAARTNSSSSNSETWSPAESSVDEKEVLGDWKKKNKCNKVIQEIDEVVRKTCEFSQRSVSNLFAVRKEVQAVYTMPQLRLLYDTTMDFVVNIEKLTSKTDYTLRGALFSQLKLFLEKYHQAQMAKLVSTLDHELWKNTEISVSRHKALEDLSSGRGVPLTLSDDREVTGDTAAPFKVVSVCGKTFRVVWSVLLMLEIAMNYMSCAANFPVLATDVLQRSIEIFRLFNSRTTQLVLGAGAMQIARLKSISARHLALASQSLDLTMTLIPHIKAALAAHFTDRQKLLLEEFDRVLRDYAEHNEKIFSKFTSIVEDQIMKRFLDNVHAEVDYDTNVSVPSNPMRGIKDSTLKLHAVLHPVLSGPQMKDVMTRVFDMFTQKLPECFKQVQPKSSAGKRRVVDDVSSFVQSFSEVQGVEFDGEALLRHFKSTYNVN